MFCALLRPRYQVSVYRTIGLLVFYRYEYVKGLATCEAEAPSDNIR